MRAPDAARILIVSDNDSDTEELKIVFQKAGLTSESAVSIAAGCESAISGRFQVVFSTPVIGNGSWKRLVEVANDYGLGFEVILLARAFDLNQWAEALQVGAFDPGRLMRPTESCRGRETRFGHELPEAFPGAF